MKSFVYAWRGMVYVWREEENFRVEITATIILIAVMIGTHFTTTEEALTTIAITMVLGSEIINTILEDTANELEPNHHSFIGKIKDMMAAFVLVNSIGAATIGLLVFYHHFGVGY